MERKSIKEVGTRYYLQTDLWRMIGAALMIIGVVWFYFGMSSASYYVPSVITPVGLVLFLVFSVRHVSDNDMEEEKNHRLQGYDHSVTERNDYTRYVLKQPADVETEAYHMGEKASYFKRGKNSTPVSDIFVKSHFFFTKDGLHICSREIALTVPRDTEGAAADTEMILPLENISKAELCKQTTTVMLSNTKKEVTVHWMELVLSDADGELLRLPVKDDMDMAGLCDVLNRMSEKRRNES